MTDLDRGVGVVYIRRRGLIIKGGALDESAGGSVLWAVPEAAY